MQYKIKENRKREFLCGALLFAAGLVIYFGNVYVMTPFFSGVVNVAGVNIYSGIFTAPLVLALVWLLLAPSGKKKVPGIAVGVGVLIIVLTSILTVSIRIKAIPVAIWVLIIAAVISGAVLMLSSVKIVRSGKKK